MLRFAFSVALLGLVGYLVVSGSASDLPAVTALLLAAASVISLFPDTCLRRGPQVEVEPLGDATSGRSTCPPSDTVALPKEIVSTHTTDLTVVLTKNGSRVQFRRSRSSSRTQKGRLDVGS